MLRIQDQLLQTVSFPCNCSPISWHTVRVAAMVLPVRDLHKAFKMFIERGRDATNPGN